MKYRIRTLRRAGQDIDEILNWLVNECHAPQGAASWLRAFEQATELLKIAADRYGIAPEQEHYGKPLRQFLFKTRRGRVYRGIFIVEGDEVVIFRVRGSGQPLVPDDELE